MSWQWYALASALFAGLTAILAKIGLTNISSNMATLVRTVVITLFLFVLIFFRREWVNPWTLDGKTLIFLVLSGFATGLSWICYFKALQTGPASLIAPIDKLSLVFTIIFALMFLGERLTLWQWGGAVLVVTGVLLIIFK